MLTRTLDTIASYLWIFPLSVCAMEAGYALSVRQLSPHPPGNERAGRAYLKPAWSPLPRCEENLAAICWRPRAGLCKVAIWA